MRHCWCGQRTAAAASPHDRIVAVDAARRGGSTLLPTDRPDAWLDLVPVLWGHLAASGLSDVPVIVLSPVAAEYVALAGQCPEWLSAARGEVARSSGSALPHARLVAAGSLVFAPSLSWLLLRAATVAPTSSPPPPAAASAASTIARVAVGGDAGLVAQLCLTQPGSGGPQAQSGVAEELAPSTVALQRAVACLGERSARPCVVLVSCDSVAAGDGAALLRLWSARRGCALVLSGASPPPARLLTAVPLP